MLIVLLVIVLFGISEFKWDKLLENVEDKVLNVFLFVISFFLFLIWYLLVVIIDKERILVFIFIMLVWIGIFCFIMFCVEFFILLRLK